MTRPSPFVKPEWLDRRVVLFGEYGSTAMGVGGPGSDRDLLGIAVPPKDYILGLERFSMYRFALRADMQTRSGAGEVEGVIYPLREFVRLLGSGNPNALIGLFLPRYDKLTAVGRQLTSSADMFLHRAAGDRFIGFLNEHRNRLVDPASKRKQNPALVEAHGYDTKFAYHMVRAGMQGIEYLTTGRMHLPLVVDQRDTLVSIREGRVPLRDALDLAGDLERRLAALRNHAQLPEHTDWTKVNKLLVDLHELAWEEDA